MKLMTNLLFRGECRDAFARYAEVLGGEVRGMFAFREAPDGGGVDEARRTGSCTPGCRSATRR